MLQVIYLSTMNELVTNVFQVVMKFLALSLISKRIVAVHVLKDVPLVLIKILVLTVNKNIS